MRDKPTREEILEAELEQAANTVQFLHDCLTRLSMHETERTFFDIPVWTSDYLPPGEAYLVVSSEDEDKIQVIRVIGIQIA